ncbi:MAG: anthranilate synthase component I [Deltaproteobacteria bacterium]|nr:anthranilate synthase component I [Candidatus Anaeroferrophillus wilburensis]MBN2888547.1 anthranilate synthase component I [Deltaproteobacteria bacterium]
MELLPSAAEFEELACRHSYVPLMCEVVADLDTPLSLYRKVARGSHSFLLESMEGGERWGRYSMIGLDPHLVFCQRGDTVTIVRRGQTEQLDHQGDPLESLKNLLAEFAPATFSGLPGFYGGAVGFLAYDTVKYFEHLPNSAADDTGFADAFFMVPGLLLVHDNLKNSLTIIALVKVGPGDDGAACYRRGVATISELHDRLRAPFAYEAAVPVDGDLSITANVSRDDFVAMVDRATEYVRAGDVIQVVLSQRFCCAEQIDPFTLYRALRLVNPSPYLYYLQFDDELLVGSSPELLVRKKERTVEVRPIAGTRPRGRTAAEDQEFEAELLADPKERAEHIMLVDLGRNDVGRIAAYGQVQVDELMAIERYSHVMHLVSHVQGQLQDDLDMFDAFRACFPAGTVSGAPKIRAMEIIDELEPTRRGPYAGAVGYFGFSGNMDFAIAIRTVMIKNGTIYFQAGAGIVADSDPLKEYEETVNKAMAIRKALERAAKGL